MGIGIRISISKSVGQEEWKSVYEESLRMIKEFPLGEIVKKEYYDSDLICMIPTKERMYKGKMGWCTTGNYITTHGAEEYFFPKELMSQYREYEEGDALAGIMPTYFDTDWSDEQAADYIEMWGAKTQGRSYHMYLLAIACMLEDRLGKKAVVSGEITIGQCRKAVELANTILDQPIKLPVRCDRERLYARVRTLSLKKTEMLYFFVKAYLGTYDYEFGEFIRNNFSEQEIHYYWKRELGSCEVDSIGFNIILKDYLVMGFDLGAVCKYIRFVDPEGKECYDEFIKKIVWSEMHIKEKDCKDYMDIDKEAEAPYSISELIAQTLCYEAHNPRVDRYIPLETIVSSLENEIGKKCNVKELFAEYLESKDNQIDESINIKEFAEDFMKQKKEERSLYDICDYEDLVYFEEGDLIEPSLQEKILKWYRFHRDIYKEKHYKILCEKGYEECSRFLIRANQYLLLKAEEWEIIFENIKNNKDSFKRYYPAVRVHLNLEMVGDLVRAFVINDAVYNYFEKLIEQKERPV